MTKTISHSNITMEHQGLNERYYLIAKH